jgi:hypothetical protein
MPAARVVGALLLCLSAASAGSRSVPEAEQARPWYNKSYHSLMDGNRLYGACQEAERSLRIEGDSIVAKEHSDGLVQAGACWGYVNGIVDSIPAGEDFEPNSQVRLSQYVDVILDCLRAHPETRHQPAFGLVRTCLARAFPARENK